MVDASHCLAGLILISFGARWEKEGEGSAAETTLLPWIVRLGNGSFLSALWWFMVGTTVPQEGHHIRIYVFLVYLMLCMESKFIPFSYTRRWCSQVKKCVPSNWLKSHAKSWCMPHLNTFVQSDFNLELHWQMARIHRWLDGLQSCLCPARLSF